MTDRVAPVFALPRPISIAHRFGNDLSRLRAAEDAGVDIVETDVWRHRGRLEVRHAHTIGPLPLMWDHGRFHRAPKRHPELAAVLDAAHPVTGFMIDLKGSHEGLPGALLAALDGRTEGRPLMVSARFWDFLPSLREHPELMLFHSIGSERNLRDVWPRLEERVHDAVSIHERLLSAARVRELRGVVDVIATWPINDDRRLERVLEWGVDAVISDDLGVLRRVAEHRRGQSTAR